MDMTEPLALWSGQEADGDVVAVAVHAGRALRDEEAAETLVPEPVRVREEDVGTAEWAVRFPTWLVAHRPRVQVDLNPSRENPVHQPPAHDLGLRPWRPPPS